MARSRTTIRIPVITVLFSLLLLIGARVTPASAQIHPPAPGVEMPQGYFDRVAQDRTAFQFKRAWIAETERAKRNRTLRILGILPTNATGAAFRVEGTRYVPVLAGKFANTAVEPYTVANLQQQLFDGPNPTGTMTDYYDEISYGYLNVTGAVQGGAGGSLFQVSQNDTYYEGAAGCNGLCGTAKTGEYLKEILDGTDGTVDFSQYDNDGPDGLPNSGDDDGFVDFVAFVHPEAGGECGGDNLWSHRWVYEGWWGSSYQTNDPAFGGGFIRVSDYTIQPLLSCDGSSLIEIGVYAHEFGHAFGLPDLYDTDSGNGSSAGIGSFGLMASGSYGGDQNHPETPTHMCAWSKEELGWMTSTVVCQDATGLSLAAADTSAQVLRVYPHGVVDTEYFLIENRVQSGFDAWLPVSGLAIFHIDNDQPGNGDETHKLVDLEEADGLFDLDNNTNRGDAGDLWPGSANRTVFNDISTPDTKDYALSPTGFSVTGINGVVDPRGFDVTVTPCQLVIGNLLVNDLPCGNNNGTLDDMEQANLAICLANDFLDDRTGVYARLVSLNAGVTVLQDSVYFGTVTCGAPACGSGEYEIQATTTFPAGTQVDFRLDVFGDSGYSSSSNFSLATGHYVLLVEDDGSASNRPLIESPINTAGYPTVVHDTAVSGTPTLGQLQGALAVVWYTGEEFDATFSAAEQAVLIPYLDGGGSLFVTGQDIGYDLVSQGNSGDISFYQDYFHANFINDTSSDQTLTGQSGDPIGNGISLDLTLGANNSTWPSVISARTGASVVFRYSASVVGAVKYEIGHRVVYFAFNFESNSPANRNTVMSRILDWLIAGDITPPDATLLAPNGGEVLSACAPVSITWNASDNLAVDVVDLELSTDGGVTFNPIATGLPNTGSHLWDPAGLTGTALRIKVKARDAATLQGVDISDADFTLQAVDPPSVSAIYPNGGESFQGGDAVEIRWTMAGVCAAVDSSQVYYSLTSDGGGAVWVYAGTAIGSDTTFAWTAPSTASDSAQVRVVVHDALANSASDDSDAYFTITASTTGLADGFRGATRPVLLQNAPNPFGAGTRFSFYLPEEAAITLRVFDLSGRAVRTVTSGVVGAGLHDEFWDGRTDQGRDAVHGIYFYVLETPQGRQVRKLVKVQ